MVWWIIKGTKVELVSVRRNRTPDVVHACRLNELSVKVHLLMGRFKRLLAVSLADILFLSFAHFVFLGLV